MSRIKSPAQPRWPRSKFRAPAQRRGRRPGDNVTADIVAGFAAAATLELTELAVNPPGTGRQRLASISGPGPGEGRRGVTLQQPEVEDFSSVSWVEAGPKRLLSVLAEVLRAA